MIIYVYQFRCQMHLRASSGDCPRWHSIYDDRYCCCCCYCLVVFQQSAAGSSSVEVKCACKKSRLAWEQLCANFEERAAKILNIVKKTSVAAKIETIVKMTGTAMRRVRFQSLVQLENVCVVFKNEQPKPEKFKICMKWFGVVNMMDHHKWPKFHGTFGVAIEWTNK